MTFRREGENAFPKETGNENPEDSSPETNEADQTQAPEGEPNSGENKDGGQPKERGFADDPRWQQRESDWKTRFNEQETRHADEIQKLREDLQKITSSRGTPSVEVPEWFGGDEQGWSQYSAHTQQLIDKAVEKALGTINQKNSDEQKAIDEATKYLHDEVATIEADKGLNSQGQKIDVNKLLKFTMDNDLVDSKGHWNYKAAFKMMNPKDVFQAKQALQERKNLVAATTSDQKPETKPSTVVTSDDFKKPGARPW